MTVATEPQAITPDLVERTVEIVTDENETIVGRLTKVTALGVMLKTKGKGQGSQAVLTPDEIVSWKLIEDFSETEQSVIRPVKINGIRRHLVNYHGWPLSKINAERDDLKLVGIHDDLHTGDEAKDVGHRHEEPKADKTANETKADAGE